MIRTRFLDYYLPHVVNEDFNHSVLQQRGIDLTLLILFHNAFTSRLHCDNNTGNGNRLLASSFISQVMHRITNLPPSISIDFAIWRKRTTVYRLPLRSAMLTMPARDVCHIA